MKCPICKKDNIKYDEFDIYEIDCTTATDIEYFLCTCSFLYYRHNNIKKIYNENNKYINANTGSGASLKYDILRLENSFNNIKEYLKHKDRFLDIGCNNGSFLKIVRNFNNSIDLFGTDVSLSDNNLHHLNSIGFKIKKTEDPNEFNLKFNFISILHVLEHIDNIDIFFKNLEDLLDIDGYIYIEVPDADGYLENYFQPFSYFDLEHINHFNLNSITLLVENYGFEIQKSWHFKFKMSEDIYYPGLGILIKKCTSKKKYIDFNISNKQISEYISKSKNDQNKFPNYINFKNKVIFGVGANTLRTLSLLKIDISYLKYFVDNNSIFHDRFVKNIAIHSKDFLINDKEAPDVIIFSKLYFNDIYNDLLYRGYQGKIISFYT
jgi:hypothetical protein